jgi:hypothetical protein
MGLIKKRGLWDLDDSVKRGDFRRFGWKWKHFACGKDMYGEQRVDCGRQLPTWLLLTCPSPLYSGPRDFLLTNRIWKRGWSVNPWLLPLSFQHTLPRWYFLIPYILLAVMKQAVIFWHAQWTCQCYKEARDSLWPKAHEELKFSVISWKEVNSCQQPSEWARMIFFPVVPSRTELSWRTWPRITVK